MEDEILNAVKNDKGGAMLLVFGCAIYAVLFIKKLPGTRAEPVVPVSGACNLWSLQSSHV